MQTSPPPGRRAIPILWSVIAALVALQMAVMLSLGSDEPDDVLRVQADWWWAAGTLLPLLLIGVALILQLCWWRGWRRVVSAVALLLFVPIALAAMFAISLASRTALAEARFGNGDRYILAREPAVTKTSHAIYRARGLWWDRALQLPDIGDRSFAGQEQLVASSDDRWLLVGRGGIWTDCFALTAEKPMPCAIGPAPYWTEGNYAAKMLMRSAEIARMTGMTPPPLAQ